jgi:hypothetical protein
VIWGKRPVAFPAAITVVLVTFRPGTGPGMAAGEMAGKRLAAFPGPMSVLVALLRFGTGPGGDMAPRRDVPAGLFGEVLADGPEEAERVVRVLAAGDTERVGLALDVGLPDAERAGLALGVGVGEPDRVGLAAGVGLEGAGRVGLGVGAAEAERSGLGVGVGVRGVGRAGLALAVGVGADVDGEAEGDADVGGDELGVLRALGPELVLAAAGEGDAEGVTALASAGTDSSQARKPPVTRPATTARRCARDM